MSSVTVGPRVEFDPDHYPRLRVWDSRAEQDRYLYLHRLAAFAHDEIDGLWSELHIHHEDHDRWNNRPENLQAVKPQSHSDYHLHEVSL